MRKAKVGTFVKRSKCKAVGVRIAPDSTLRFDARAFILTCLARRSEFFFSIFDF